MKKIKLSAQDRGTIKNADFKGLTLFNLGERGTKRPGNFGPLYVFNDDILYANSFLGMHPHSNVEIVTIMLSGEESHKDTLGIHEKYFSGDVQLISAGSGIRHSGGNTSADLDARHLQIWIQPNQFDTTPQVSVLKADKKNLQQGPIKLLVSPNAENGSLKIDQQTWISELTLEAGVIFELYSRSKNYGTLFYILDGGEARIDEEELSTGDTLFFSEWEKTSIAVEKEPVKLLLIETTL